MRAPTATTALRPRLVAVATLCAACGGAPRADRDEGEASGFSCNERMAGYVAHGTLGADEIGVAIDCSERGPRLVRWRVEAGGTRAEDAVGLSPGQFEALWQKLDGTGWRDLQDCAGGDDREPTYTFTFRDATAAASFACQRTEPPFPYHTILDELDVAATRGRRQLGPDDVAPDELAPEREAPR